MWAGFVIRQQSMWQSHIRRRLPPHTHAKPKLPHSMDERVYLLWVSHSPRCDAIGLPSSTELILNASEVVGVCKSCHTLSWSIKRNFGWVRVLSRNLQLWPFCPMVALIQFPSRMLTCRFRVPAICISRGRAALSTCMASKVDLPNVSQLCEKARLSLTPEEVNYSLIVWGDLRWLRIRNSSWFCCATCGW